MSNAAFRKYTIVTCTRDSAGNIPNGSIGVFKRISNYQYVVSFLEHSNYPMAITELKKTTFTDILKYIAFRIKKLFGKKNNG